jgi:hypothetical protein
MTFLDDDILARPVYPNAVFIFARFNGDTIVVHINGAAGDKNTIARVDIHAIRTRNGVIGLDVDFFNLHIFAIKDMNAPNGLIQEIYIGNMNLGTVVKTNESWTAQTRYFA